jgi:hypothetical protein
MRARLSRLALLAVGALLALSCRSSTEPVVTPDPMFTGQWKGGEWKGDASVRVFASGGAVGDRLYVNSRRVINDGTGIYEEYLSMNVAFHGVGSYVLDSTSVVVRVIIGGDGISASYGGIGANAGVLDITTFGGVGGSIDGTVRFDARQAGLASSPTLRFENGHFRAPVQGFPPD